MIRATKPHAWPPVTAVSEDDPKTLEKMNAVLDQHDKNFACFQARAGEIIRNNRGKFICIAGGELFSADTFDAAFSAARAKHPEDGGIFFRYVSPERRIFIG